MKVGFRKRYKLLISSRNREQSRRNNIACGICWSIVFLLLLLSVSGCEIDFEAQTVVEPDGSVARTTRYVADEDSDKEEIKTYYDLPPGGAWTTRKGTKYDWQAEEEREGMINIYEVTKRYAPGEPILQDYVRRGKTPEHVSHNEIRLTAHNYVFVKTFDYEERFRDIGSKKGSVAAMRKFYTLCVEYFAEQLVQELKDSVTIDKARQALEEIFAPLLTTFIEGIQNEGKAFFESTVFEELGSTFDGERIVPQVVKALPPPSDEQADSWNEAVTRAFDNTADATEDFFIETRLEEELYGVYGFTLFQTYGFKTALSLPGDIVDSNATKQDGNILTWEFGTSDLQWEDYVLRARSRIIYPGRIVPAGITVLVILGVSGILIWQRRKEKNRGKE